MKHIKAIGIKFIVISIVLFSILASFYTATLTDILLLSVLITGVAYVVGDLYILPRFGNLVATTADFGLSFFAIWVLSNLLFLADYGVVTASFFSAVLISSSEALFHIYMQNKILNHQKDMYIDRKSTMGNLQTEFAEENPNKDIIELNKEDNKED
ncbi:YndM family protein [Aquibacillus rhizosphaerae]|uniref:YndM family protein n=1 Tax=Aquibacillus rhizosphaerae TaxID=3051431 RepID=A0ABT7L1U8_9BACI|nr:YndM family protein [Aquibacillus sp. LR5S19]MDL4839359.1 YndM family protein [Aquibacillus sp. LR5S19]